MGPLLSESMCAIILPELHVEIQNTVTRSVEPILAQVQSQTKKYLELENENKNLKHENKIMSDKLVILESSNEDLEQHDNVPITQIRWLSRFVPKNCKFC